MLQALEASTNPPSPKSRVRGDSGVLLTAHRDERAVSALSCGVPSSEIILNPFTPGSLIIATSV